MGLPTPLGSTFAGMVGVQPLSNDDLDMTEVCPSLDDAHRWDGDLVNKYTVETAAVCQTQCTSVEACEFFVFESTTTMCSLKANFTERRIAAKFASGYPCN